MEADHPASIADAYLSMIKRYPDDRATIINLENQDDISPFDISDLIAEKLFAK